MPRGAGGITHQVELAERAIVGGHGPLTLKNVDLTEV